MKSEYNDESDQDQNEYAYTTATSSKSHVMLEFEHYKCRYKIRHVGHLIITSCTVQNRFWYKISKVTIRTNKLQKPNPLAKTQLTSQLYELIVHLNKTP